MLKEIKEKAFQKVLDDCQDYFAIISYLEDCTLTNVESLSNLKSLIVAGKAKNTDRAMNCFLQWRGVFKPYVEPYAFDWQRDITDIVYRIEKLIVEKLEQRINFETFLLNTKDERPSIQFYKLLDRKTELELNHSFKTSLVLLSRYGQSFDRGIVRCAQLLGFNSENIDLYWQGVIRNLEDCPKKVYPKICILSSCLGDRNADLMNDTDRTILSAVLSGLTSVEIQKKVSDELDQTRESIQPGQIIEALTRLQLCQRDRKKHNSKVTFDESIKLFILSCI